jgi:hypothetical protein
MTLSNQEIGGVVVVRPASSFRSSTGRPRRCFTKTTANARAIDRDARIRHTKLTLPRFRQLIDPRAPEVFLSAL